MLLTLSSDLFKHTSKGSPYRNPLEVVCLWGWSDEEKKTVDAKSIYKNNIVLHKQIDDRCGE